MLESIRNNYVKDGKKTELREYFQSHGYKEYRPDCFTKCDVTRPMLNGFCRYRMTENTLRRESYDSGSNKWDREVSGYYSKITIKDGKITGLTR